MDPLGLQAAIKQANDDMAALTQKLAKIEGVAVADAKTLIDYAALSFGSQMRLTIDYAEAAAERLIVGRTITIK